MHSNDLLVVWTTWQTTPALTASVSDGVNLNGNPYPTAVGPTVQSLSSSPTSAQIFYVPSLVNTSPITVTVTLTAPVGAPSQTVSFFGMAMAEYTGNDPNYPLDSISAGYSYSGGAGTALDSGAAAPANPTLMVFGAGIIDAAGSTASTPPFTVRQQNNTGNCAFIEDNTSPTAAVLQRATASCANSGNWLMQMAVFRSASSTVVGGWSPTRPPQYINAAQYPGADICIQAKNATAANPTANILVPVNGTQPCSVDPTGDWSDSPISAKGGFDGGMEFYATGTSGQGELDVAQPWLFIKNNVTVNFHSVNIVATNNFRHNYSGKRCWTNGGAITTGNPDDCETGSVSTLSVTRNMPATGCAQVKLSMTSNTAYQIRGGEFVDMLYFAETGNNGIFRVSESRGGEPCGSSGGPSISGGVETFNIWAPDAVSCSGSTCGSAVVIAAPTAIWYMGLRSWDTAGTSNPSKECIAIDGTTDTAYACNEFGLKLLNVGKVTAVGYGVEGYDNSECEENCVVDNRDSRAVYKVSAMTYRGWSNTSQNNSGIKHGEDYCNNTNDNCLSCSSTSGCTNYAAYGAFHVGLAEWDTWTHAPFEDFTINENAHCGVMFDGNNSFSSGTGMRGFHFQAGGKLAHVCIGTQSPAAAVRLEHVESNGDEPSPAANILIGGSNYPPKNWDPSDNNWIASTNFEYYSVIYPTSHNSNGNYFVVTTAGTTSSSEPNWDSSCGSLNNVCPTDGTVVWTNAGTHYPNSAAPSGTTVIDASLITNQNSKTPAIFNGVTNTTWTRQQIATYVFDNQGTTYEVSSSDTYPATIGQGLAAGTYGTTNNCAGNGTAANPSVVSCGNAVAGAFSCNPGATGATCIIDTTGVTANSEVIVLQNTSEGTRLGVTCNTGNVVPTTVPLVASKSVGTSFTINLNDTGNPACFDYWIVN